MSTARPTRRRRGLEEAPRRTFTVYTWMLILAFLFITTGCVLLAMELTKYGPVNIFLLQGDPWWRTKEARLTMNVEPSRPLRSTRWCKTSTAFMSKPYRKCGVRWLSKAVDGTRRPPSTALGRPSYAKRLKRYQRKNTLACASCLYWVFVKKYPSPTNCSEQPARQRPR